jgi:branched-chain amino acid transport system ATP-binding protein
MDRMRAADSLLRVDAVAKRYGGVQALDDVSFAVAPGTITALIGPNGAGKTTLLNVVSGVIPPNGGRVAFKGVDVTRWPSYRICKLGFGRTFQNIHLFPTLNALENVLAARYCRTRANFLDSLLALPRDRRERKHNLEVARQALDAVGIYERRFQMPRELPYGDQRRLEIARALATEPTLLMLDEPAAGMIEREASDLGALMVRLRDAGTTILLIEHNVGLVMNVSEKIVVLQFGKLIAEGTPAAVQANPAVIEAYLGVGASVAPGGDARGD